MKNADVTKRSGDLPVFSLTVEQLDDLLAEKISNAIYSIKLNEFPLLPKYSDPKEMSQKLGITRQSLHTYTQNGIIPHIKLGRTVLYCEQDVYRALTKNDCKLHMNLT